MRLTRSRAAALWVAALTAVLIVLPAPAVLAGDGTFSVLPPLRTGDSPSFVALGDFNSDGDVDLAIANRKEQQRDHRHRRP